MFEIKFKTEREDKRGFEILLHAGTIVFGAPGIYLVPKSSLAVLKRKKIKFDIVSPSNGNGNHKPVEQAA